MRGLRTQESDKFNVYFELVQAKAKALNKVFFLDSGEGRDFSTENMEGEDLSGWLVPENQADEFEKQWIKFANLEDWCENVVFVLWRFENDSEIKVEFKVF
jgi:hypothetical protein